MTRRSWLVLTLGSMCAFITSLNQSIMAVAFTDLRRSFDDVPASRLSWILNIYTIVAGATLILSAVASNRYGRKRVLLTGLATFCVAGVACSMAPGPSTLIAARGVQAIGWALITPSAIAVILAEVPDHRRAGAIAIWGGVGGVATALGPSLGAVLIDLGSWRMAFAASVPFGALVLPIGAKVFRESAPHELVLFLTEVWGYSVVRAGALITPIAAMVTVLAPVAGRVADRVGHRVLVVPAGLFWLSGGLWLLVRAGDTPDLLHVWFPAAFLLGIGSGLGWPTIHGIPMIGIEPKDFSAAVATNQTVLRVVGSLGVAIAITLISGAGGATMSPFRRLFVLMAVSGALLSVVGSFVDTSPRRATR